MIVDGGKEHAMDGLECFQVLLSITSLINKEIMLNLSKNFQLLQQQKQILNQHHNQHQLHNQHQKNVNVG